MTLTGEQLDHLDSYGYLKVEGVLDSETFLDPIIAEYHGVLDSLADDLFERGEISSKHGDLAFGERITRIYEESGAVHNQYFDFSLPQKGIEANTPFWVGPAIFSTLTNQRLLDVVESVVGPEIYSNPVQHVRIKVPESRAPRTDEGYVQFGATPWHQDEGVVTEEADATDMLTVWFPLLDASIENGCLQVIPGTHKGGLLQHCPGPQGHGLEIPEDTLGREGARAMPMRRGDILLLNQRTAHAALPNVSEEVRWSFDLRYHVTGRPTGRPSFPGFVARSRTNPETELHDHVAWQDSWLAARDSLAAADDPTYNRWDSDDPACA
jgi:phytanoyl-CoA hydroxylase